MLKQSTPWRATALVLAGFLALAGAAAAAEDPVSDPGVPEAVGQVIEVAGLPLTYHIPSTDPDELEVHLVVLSGEAHNDDDEGLAHYVEHLAWLNVRGLACGSPPTRCMTTP